MISFSSGFSPDGTCTREWHVAMTRCAFGRLDSAGEQGTKHTARRELCEGLVGRQDIAATQCRHAVPGPQDVREWGARCKARGWSKVHKKEGKARGCLLYARSKRLLPDGPTTSSSSRWLLALVLSSVQYEYMHATSASHLMAPPLPPAAGGCWH
eukprot:1161815-Pelagomonas_calceolata.AAC.18